MRVRTLLLGFAALPLAVLATHDAAIGYYRAHSDQTPSFLKEEPAIYLRAKDMRLFGSTDASADEEERIANTARNVLQRTPLSAAALRQIALAEGRSTNQGAVRLATAEKISRRDLPTQASLFDAAAARADFPGAIHHLDNVLTVFPNAGTAIYPMLASELEDPQLRAALAPSSARPWFRSLLKVAASSAEPLSVAALIKEGRIAFNTQDAAILSGLITRLLGAREYAAAREVAVTAGRAVPQNLDTFAFTAATTSPAFAPLTWRISNSDAIAIQQAGDDVLSLDVRPGQGGLIAERVTMLVAGTYILEQDIRSDSAPDTRMEWKVACGAKASREAQIWRQPVPVPAGTVHYRSTVVIPTHCEAQNWQLRVLTSERQTPTLIRIGIRLDRQ